MLRHIVLLRFTPDTTRAQADALVEELEELWSRFPSIRSAAIGRDLGLREGNSHVLLELEFDDDDAWRAYQDHPDHQAFVRDTVGPLLDVRTAIQVDAD